MTSGFAVEADAQAVRPVSSAVVLVHTEKLPCVDLVEVGLRHGCL